MVWFYCKDDIFVFGVKRKMRDQDNHKQFFQLKVKGNKTKLVPFKIRGSESGFAKRWGALLSRAKMRVAPWMYKQGAE
jgi:hypothetical protein